jgi:predicted pyridoxine 5'-phosphate oxidase superfamily flavin-nucleotide-binding protein
MRVFFTSVVIGNMECIDQSFTLRGIFMSRAFSDITFTPSVKAAQEFYGSREGNRHFELADEARNELTDAEITFIQARDSFYQATVSENGWPYLQHRGGPIGFLKVLDARTIGFADFRGNRQYLSVGNINANERISMILMDYPWRRRLKLWGRARIVHESEQPDIIAAVGNSAYRAHIERAMVIHVEAFDWNCPQHITPRFSEEEIRAYIAPIIAENENLKAQLQLLLKNQQPN